MGKPVIVAGHRWKPGGCAVEMFRLAFDLPTFQKSGDAYRFEDRLNEFVDKVPAWVAHDVVVACQELSDLVRARRPGDVPPLGEPDGDG